MNTTRDHLDKARRSRDFLQSLTVTDYNADWAIIVLFYRALHLVRAYIHQAGRDHGSSHTQTISEANSLLPGPLSGSFYRLYSRSRVCRYDDLGAMVGDYMQLDNAHFQPLLAYVRRTLPAAV